MIVISTYRTRQYACCISKFLILRPRSLFSFIDHVVSIIRHVKPRELFNGCRVIIHSPSFYVDVASLSQHQPTSRQAQSPMPLAVIRHGRPAYRERRNAPRTYGDCVTPAAHCSVQTTSRVESRVTTHRQTDRKFTDVQRDTSTQQ